MIISVSTIDGIRQYSIPDNIKQIIVAASIVIVITLSLLVWYIVHLHDNVKTLAVSTDKHLLVYKNRISSLEQELKDVKMRYANMQQKRSVFFDHEHKMRDLKQKLASAEEQYEKVKLENQNIKRSLRSEIEKLKEDNRRFSKKLKEVNGRIAKSSKLVKEKNKELSMLKKKIEELKKRQAARQQRSLRLRLVDKKTQKSSQAKQASKKKSADDKKNSAMRVAKTNVIPKIAKAKLGNRYVWGAVGPAVFDCSGFTTYVYKKVGIHLPRTSREQAHYGRLVKRDQLKPGDLVFFDTDLRRNGIDHVGIYIGNNQFIHASSARKKVIITSLSKAFYNQRFRLARRVN